MTAPKEKRKQSADDYSAEHFHIMRERPTSKAEVKDRLHRALKVLAKSGLARGFSEEAVAEIIASYAINSRKSLTMFEADEISREAVQAAFEEWRSLPE